MTIYPERLIFWVVEEKKFIDTKKLLNEAATSVPIDLLLARGKSTVKLVSRDKLGELINQAVMNILRKYQHLEGKAGAITQETKLEFAELMAEYKKSLEVQESLKHSKEGMQSEIEELKKHVSSRAADGSEVDLLERRIEKLSGHAKNLENALKALAEQKIYSNTQIQGILTDLGVNPEDKTFEKKMKMFKIILDENKKIQSSS